MKFLSSLGAWSADGNIHFGIGVATDIPTKGNSVVISIARKAEECRNGY